MKISFKGYIKRIDGYYFAYVQISYMSTVLPVQFWQSAPYKKKNECRTALKIMIEKAHRVLLTADKNFTTD